MVVEVDDVVIRVEEAGERRDQRIDRLSVAEDLLSANKAKVQAITKVRTRSRVGYFSFFIF